MSRRRCLRRILPRPHSRPRRVSNSLRFRRKPRRHSNLAPLRRNKGPLQLSRRSLRSSSSPRPLCRHRRQRRSMSRHLWRPRAQGPTSLRLPWREPRGSCSGVPNWARSPLSLFGSRRRRKGANSARTSIRSKACALSRNTLGRTVSRAPKTHKLSPRKLPARSRTSVVRSLAMNVARPKLLRLRLRHCAQPPPPRRPTRALRAPSEAVARSEAIAGRSSACSKFETVSALAGAHGS